MTVIRQYLLYIKMSSALRTFAIGFLIGGIIIGSVRLAASKVSVFWAAIFGALPLGIISMFFIANSQAEDYTKNYVQIAVISIVAIVFMLVLLAMNVPRVPVVIIGLVTWAALNGMRYYAFDRPTARAELTQFSRYWY